MIVEVLLGDDDPSEAKTARIVDVAVTVDGVACPSCNATPLRVQGFRGSLETHGEAEFAAAGCVACRRHVGTIKILPESLFGRDEDARVMSRGRIY